MTGRKKIIILLMAVSLIVIPFGSSAIAKNGQYPIDNSGEVMAMDFVVVRPLQIAGLVIGAAFFVVSWPFSALGDNADLAYQKMMVEPARLAFSRPLGVF